MTVSGRWAARVAAVGVVVAAGCSPSAKVRPPDPTPATVVVLIDGQPLPDVYVTLIPTTPGYTSEANATGVTDAAGRATLVCGEQPGACPGPNTVVVTEKPMTDDEIRRSIRDQSFATPATGKDAPPGRPIPPDYTGLYYSPVVVQVVAGPKEYAIDLKRPPAAPADQPPAGGTPTTPK